MTTLITWSTGTGQHFRCDAKCYNAKGQKCVCLCGGKNHGAGLKQAAKNVEEIAKVYLDLYVEPNTEAIQQILAQQELFPPEL